MINSVWALEKDSFNEDDQLWCSGLGVKFKADPLFCNIYSYGKMVSQDIQGWRIRLFSTTEKQETMLKLKYGNKLLLIQQYTDLTAYELRELDF